MDSLLVCTKGACLAGCDLDHHRIHHNLPPRSLELKGEPPSHFVLLCACVFRGCSANMVITCSAAKIQALGCGEREQADWRSEREESNGSKRPCGAGERRKGERVPGSQASSLLFLFPDLHFPLQLVQNSTSLVRYRSLLAFVPTFFPPCEAHHTLESTFLLSDCILHTVFSENSFMVFLWACTTAVNEASLKQSLFSLECWTFRPLY